jgi:hypothetical protein
MFDQKGMKAHTSYSKHGYWFYDVRFGGEKELPADVKRIIKSNYRDYTIGKATEVTIGNQKAWVVNLEDANNLVLARVMDGNLDELSHYNTQAHSKPRRKARVEIPE